MKPSSLARTIRKAASSPGGKGASAPPSEAALHPIGHEFEPVARQRMGAEIGVLPPDRQQFLLLHPPEQPLQPAPGPAEPVEIGHARLVGRLLLRAGEGVKLAHAPWPGCRASPPPPRPRRRPPRPRRRPAACPASDRNRAFRISSGSRATWPPAMCPVSCASTPARSPTSDDCWSRPVLMNSRLPVVTKAFMGRAWISVIRTSGRVHAGHPEQGMRDGAEQALRFRVPHRHQGGAGAPRCARASKRERTTPA